MLNDGFLKSGAPPAFRHQMVADGGAVSRSP